MAVISSGDLGNGPFVYATAVKLVDNPTVSTGECAALVQHYIPNLRRKLDAQGNAIRGTGTKDWVEGLKVRGNGHKILKGTAIATFVNGRYEGKAHGNHAAFYLEQHPLKGIKVAEQFEGLDHIQGRWLKFKGKTADGKYNDPSNNGDAFSVIMLALPSLFEVDG